MRVIAGEFRSRKLVAPDAETTRPTTDRARETLFNVLTNYSDLTGLRVLDLFAGSGALAIEALSRGAASAVLVEKNRKAVAAIRKNLQELRLEGRGRIVEGDVFSYLARTSEQFDLVLCDAPYSDLRALKELPATLVERGILAPGSLCVLEHRTGTTVEAPARAEIVRELKVGEAAFTLLKPTPDEQELS